MSRTVLVYMAIVVVALACHTARASEIVTASDTNYGDFYIGGIFRSPLEFRFADKMGGISFDYMTPTGLFKFMAGCDAWIGHGGLGGMLRAGGVLSTKATGSDIFMFFGVGVGFGLELLDTSEITGDLFYSLNGFGMAGVEFGISDDVRIRVVMDAGYGYFCGLQEENVGSMIIKGGVGVVL